jgi:hypothetical protein
MGVRKYVFAIFAVTAALMVFLGVGSASATVLCNESASSCTSYEAASTLEASLTGSGTLSTTGGTLLDTCTLGVIGGTTGNTGGSTETVNEPIGELTWELCTNTTDTTNKGELEIHWISGTNNGTVTGKSISVTLNTASGSCTYSTGTALDLGTLTGGNPATIDVNTVLAKQAGGFLCPTEVRWVASYSVVSPEPLYVGESALGAAPRIKLVNTGVGVPEKGTNHCIWGPKDKFEICEVKVTNSSGFNVIILNEELIQTGERFKLIKGCGGVGKEIAAKGGSCLVQVELIEEPGKNWRHAYYLRVKEKGKEPPNVTAERAGLNT